MEGAQAGLGPKEVGCTSGTQILLAEAKHSKQNPEVLGSGTPGLCMW